MNHEKLLIEMRKTGQIPASEIGVYHEPMFSIAEMEPIGIYSNRPRFDLDSSICLTAAMLTHAQFFASYAVTNLLAAADRALYKTRCARLCISGKSGAK